jgi:hypothetical protein
MTTTGIDTDILELVMSEEVEKKTEAILELAGSCWPDRGAFLIGVGVGEYVALGKSDAEIESLVRLALEKLRAFLHKAVQAEGDRPS